MAEGGRVMLDWIKKHPQRTTGLLLQVFAYVQGALAMFQAHVPPFTFAAITAAFGIVVTILGWVVKNTTDSQEPQQ
jgi:drug/metabolite transporter (DMT)-like permease